MESQSRHSWDVSPKEACEIQLGLQNEIVLADEFDEIRYVAGTDLGISVARQMGRAAVVVLKLPELNSVETAVVELPLRFPYIPGLLSFREIPLILAALEKLSIKPDLLLCDGQGIAHPRRFGIACHLGLLTGIPALGVAKTRLVGDYTEPGIDKGCRSILVDKGEAIGVVLRTRTNVKPVYISPGHKISLPSSVDFVMRCVTRYRLPETTRRAHSLSLFTR